MTMWPDRTVVEAKTGDRPIRMAGSFITRDEANAAAIVIGASFGIAAVVVLALVAASTKPQPSDPRPVVATTQELP